MSWHYSDEQVTDREIAEFIQRQLSPGCLTGDASYDYREVTKIRKVRGGQTKPPWFEITTASGQHFKITIEDND